MNKIALSLIAAFTFSYTNFIFAGSSLAIKPSWTGFYLGGNAGYWESSYNRVDSIGSASYVNPTYELGASNIANALAEIGFNNFSLHSDGFIGGGQAGYNFESSKGVLFGLGIDFNGLTNSNNAVTMQKTVDLVDFDENYLGSLSVKQSIHYLGALTARIGYLFSPTFLIYGMGGVAYGHVSLETSWTAQESLGSTIFPTVAAQNNVNETLKGWTVGGGLEWLFKPNWSAMLEYNYYSFNSFNVPVTLAQMNQALSPSVLWASAATKTTLSLSLGAIRLGINYHF